MSSSLSYEWFEQEPLILNVLSFIHPKYVFFNTVECKGEKKNYKFAPLWMVNKLWKELLFSERFCKLYYVNCLCGGSDTVLPFAPDAGIVAAVTRPEKRKKRNRYNFNPYMDFAMDEGLNTFTNDYDDFDSDEEDEEAHLKTFSDNHVVFRIRDDDDDISDDEYYIMTGEDSPCTSFMKHLKSNAKDQATLNQIAMRAIRRAYLSIYPNLNFTDNFFQLLSILRGALVVYEGYNFKVKTKMEDLMNSYKEYFPGGDLQQLESELCESGLRAIQTSGCKETLISNIHRCLNYIPYYQHNEVSCNLRKAKLYNMFRDSQNYIFGEIYENVIIFKDDGNVLFYNNATPNETLLNGLTTATVSTDSTTHYINTCFNEKEITQDISLMLEDMFIIMNRMFEISQGQKIRNIEQPEKTAYSYYTNIVKPKMLIENPDKSRKEIVSMVSKMWKELPTNEKDAYKKKLEEKKAQYIQSVTNQTVSVRGLHNTEQTIQFKRIREDGNIPVTFLQHSHFFGGGGMIAPPSKFRRFY
ncbi:predicted protein [Naegleria gruberi]|uniref:Predicted protein n=1 Tax=Naegleria gruberi TaxID=5762 RepID=D2VF18_NAEGR|nr:uncharacterized protein NAEGRDRAFT_49009 [Naegleria gruberi]EFC44698.1 predicted protein [Naegleria gruberi]|eukprot:XP_002677442.1 predicted protein [Naegleria gruberi strain NEG-M]